MIFNPFIFHFYTMSRLHEARKFLGLTQKAVAEILQIGQNTYSMIETGKISLTDKNKGILSDKLRINPLWLGGGVGEMFLDMRSEHPEKAMIKGHSKGPDVKLNNGVPFYPKAVTGSLTISLDDIASEQAEYYINFAPFNDCSFYRPVWGESMSPKYTSADTIACKKIINKNYILYGEAYLCVIALDGDFYETIKILRKHNSDPSKIILKPANPAFDETTIPLDSILELYIIKGKIERNI